MPQPSDNATKGKGQKYPCKWEGCKGGEHCDEPRNLNEYYPDNGTTERGNCGNWKKPFHILTHSYTHYGVKEGEFRGLKSDKYKVSNGKSNCNNYTTQPHHVIPVDNMNSYEILKHNLKLSGWNINDEESNGICLPYFREDQIWHCLQPHRGSHPKGYCEDIEESLGKLEGKIGKYCTEKDDKKEMEQLVNDMALLVKRIRDGILNWTIAIHRSDTLENWANQVVNKSIKRIAAYYKIIGGSKSSQPPYTKKKYTGREYPTTITD
jgi:hypothetical protein